MLLFFVLATASVITTNPPDAWIDAPVHHPPPFDQISVRSNMFRTLHAEAVSGQLQIMWADESVTSTGTEIVLISSADPIGHWPARDWHAQPMHRHGAVWQANIILDGVDVPVGYFVVQRFTGTTNLSPIRQCYPRSLGITEPSRLFWPFLEGFEQGLESWRCVSPGTELRTTQAARSGRNALELRISAKRQSVTVTTTRLRGWFAEEHGAIGVAFWARTMVGTGRLRCSFFANAFTTNQVVAQSINSFELTPKYQRFKLLFAEHPLFDVGELDLMSFEFTAAPEAELLIDDMYLVGRWRFE
jgi:hypothetical protein